MTRIDLTGLEVALVHDSLTVPGGAEKVLLELHRLFPTAPIYTPLFRPEKLAEFRDADVRTSALNRWRWARNHHQIMIPLLPYFMEQFDLSSYDVVISDSSAVAKGAITPPETLHVCYCHTPMRWAWLPHLDKRASDSFIRRLAGHYLRVWDAATVSRVDVWLANSKTTAARIAKFYRREATVIYPPVDVEEISPSVGNDGYYLAVGRLIAGNYKRTDLIIEACIKADVPLKVVGDGPMLPALKKLARGHPKVEFLGFVDQAKRDRLYAGCRAFLFAAEEDAGIVPIEAMAHGKPVICFDRGGAAETVLHGLTGIHFPTPTADSLALAIETAKKKSFDAKAIAAHAQTFSAGRFKREFLAQLATVVENWSKTRYGGARSQGDL